MSKLEDSIERLERTLDHIDSIPYEERTVTDQAVMRIAEQTLARKKRLLKEKTLGK